MILLTSKTFCQVLVVSMLIACQKCSPEQCFIYHLDRNGLPCVTLFSIAKRWYRFTNVSENSCLPISIQFVILGILCIKTGHQSSGKQEDKTTSYFWIPGFSGLKYHTMSNNLHKQAIDLQMLKFLCNTINEYI